MKALQYKYNSHPDIDLAIDSLTSVDTDIVDSGNTIQTLDSLNDDEFQNVRQLIYDRYNPSDAPDRWPPLYLQCEAVFCRKEEHQFKYAIEHGNRFSILLATARVAKARYSWYKQYYQTFKENE